MKHFNFSAEVEHQRVQFDGTAGRCSTKQWFQGRTHLHIRGENQCPQLFTPLKLAISQGRFDFIRSQPTGRLGVEEHIGGDYDSLLNKPQQFMLQ